MCHRTTPRATRPLIPVVLATALAALLAVAPATRATAEGPAPIDDFIADYAATNGLPGVAVAVVKDGEVIHEAATGEGITPDTPMMLGSISKTFTAFAVLQLVDDGRIDLDDPVVDHLPDFTMDDPRADRISVRQLLSHTSGIPNPIIVPEARTAAQRVDQLGSMSLSSDPGTTYLYSNLGYQLAAQLVAEVSGQEYVDHLTEHIFEPLGMDDTWAVVTTGDEPGQRDGHVTAYGTAIPMQEMEALMAGNGSVISTAHDAGLWLGMLQRGGVAEDGTRLLSEELITEAQQPQPSSPHYGLGWEHTQTSDPARVGHSGTMTRYSARVDLVPSSGYGVVVLTNSFTTMWDHPFSISTGIIDITEGNDPGIGAPVPTIVDLVLAVITFGILALGVRGVVRAGRWVARRRARATWRFVLRQLPHAIAPALAVFVFAVVPTLQGNAATPVDVFGMWPAVMVLLLAAGLTGAAVIAARSVHRFSRGRPAVG